MDAEPSPQKIVQRLRSPQKRQLRRKRSFAWKQGGVFLETVLKLTCNILLSGGTVFALLQLWPYHQSQQKNLSRVQLTLKEAQASTHQLRADFGRYFDAAQAYIIMQEQSGLTDPQTRPIIFLESDAEQ